MNRRERRERERVHHRWLKAVSRSKSVDSALLDTARLVAAGTDAQGRIIDPVLLRVLREIDRERADV